MQRPKMSQSKPKGDLKLAKTIQIEAKTTQNKPKLTKQSKTTQMKTKTPK